VVFTPFIALMFGKKEVTVKTIIACFIAIVGIYFLSVLGKGGVFQFYIGDILLVLCAFFFALQIIWVGHFIDNVNPISISSVMLLTMGLLSVIMIPIFNEPLPLGFKGISGVLYAAIFSSGVCSILQLYGQRHTTSSNASIILSLETPIACILAIIIHDEFMNNYMTIGLILMIISVLLIEIKFKRKINLKKYKHLLIDVDDTLLDFQKAEQQAFIKLLSDYSIEYNDEYYQIYKNENKRLWKEFELGHIEKKMIFDNRMIPLFEKLKIEDDPVKASYKFLDYLSEGAYLIGDTYKILEKLSKKYKLYVITNGVAKVQYPRLEKVGIDKFFTKIFVSEEIGYQKPKKEFFDYVSLNIEGFKKEEVLVIGDSLTSDIIGAIKYGIDTCWFNPNGLDTDLNISYKIKSLNDLK
jgi:2-haloacid dehalogenase